MANVSKQQFMEYAYNNGYAKTPEEMKTAMDEFRAKGNSFTDDKPEGQFSGLGINYTTKFHSPIEAVKNVVGAVGQVGELAERTLTAPTDIIQGKFGIAPWRKGQEYVANKLEKIPVVGKTLGQLSYGATSPLTIMTLGQSAAGKIVGKTAEGMAMESLAKQTGANIKRSIPSTIEKEGIKLQKSAAPKKTFVEKLPGIGSRIGEGDRSLLAEVKAPKTISYNEYVKVAKASSPKLPGGNPRNITPDALAGVQAKKALDEVARVTSKVGAKKQKLIEQNANNFIAADDIVEKFNSMLKERLGAEANYVNKDGVVSIEVAPIAGRAIRKPDEINLIKEAYSAITKLKETPSIALADDIKSQLRGLYEAPKASQVKPVTTTTEGIIKSIRGLIDERINNVIGKNKYQKVNREYVNLLDIKNQLNSRLGQITDPATGQTRHGASLMKSAVQSTADRGTRALFERVKEITGYDLMQDAKYAEIAMKAAKDPRIYNLLEEVGGVSDIMRGKAGMAVNLTKATIGKLRVSELDETVKYYNKYQKLGKTLGQPVIGKPSLSVAKPALNEKAYKIGQTIGKEKHTLGKLLKNERGSIDLTSNLTPAIKSPETGRIYTGIRHKEILDRKITKIEPKIEKKVWTEIFKDNTGDYSPYVGFVDKNGNYISRFDAEKKMTGSLTQQFHSGVLGGLGAKIISDKNKKNKYQKLGKTLGNLTRNK